MRERSAFGEHRRNAIWYMNVRWKGWGGLHWRYLSLLNNTHEEVIRRQKQRRSRAAIRHLFDQ